MTRNRFDNGFGRIDRQESRGGVYEGRYKNMPGSGSRSGRSTEDMIHILIWAAILVLTVVVIVLIAREYRGQAAEVIEEDAVEEPVQAETVDPVQETMDEAALQAAMYDYDAAIATLKDSGYYDTNFEMQSMAEDFQAQKDACVAWEPEQITHVFYHTLIVDPSKAFDGGSMQDGYNQYMCTIDEFNVINQTMYDEGYVMVSMHDMCTVNDDGTVEPETIWLPEGKIPYVLSQDDVSYYQYMTGDGFASKLVIDENGDVKNEYIEDDGTVSVGNYDMVPLIDAFAEEHPDACYHGHKGTIALTGYEGVLGYRTDEVYLTREESRLTYSQIEFFEDNPDFDEAAWQNEVDQATAVAEAMKENGWEFASHTWGHIDPLVKGYDSFVQDTDRWTEWVEPIIGDTDIIIFAFGADISDGMAAYAEDNAYYRYLKDVAGFNILCLVDSNRYFVQFNGTSMRMGRRDIDGYRMYYTPDKLSDLFNVEDVWDESRPTPVPNI